METKRLRAVPVRLLLAAAMLVGSAAPLRGDTGNEVVGLLRHSHPPLVRFQGTLYIPADAPEKDQALFVFDLIVEDTTWLFFIEKAHNMSYAETHLGVLKDLFPRRLYAFGHEDVLKDLQKPELAGLPLSLLGYLYRGSHRFQISEFEVLSESE